MIVLSSHDRGRRPLKLEGTDGLHTVRGILPDDEKSKGVEPDTAPLEDPVPAQASAGCDGNIVVLDGSDLLSEQALEDAETKVPDLIGGFVSPEIDRAVVQVTKISDNSRAECSTSTAPTLP